ncbi:MAG: hypothetical protein PVG83_01945 [Acidimicrobiia bacterium]|jgi:hypothetical protein
MSDQIESALRHMAEHIGFPDTPEFETPSSPPRRLRRLWPAVAVAVTVLVILFAFPGPRDAVAHLFGIGAVRIELVDELSPTDLVETPTGSEMSLSEAGRLVDFDILTLAGEPDAVLVDESVPGGMVTIAYGEGRASYRVLITQLEGETDLGAVRKHLLADTVVTQVEVGGEVGYWIEGDGHVLMLLDREGEAVEHTARLAADTLLYEDDGRTVRIEGDFDLETALEIADHLR